MPTSSIPRRALLACTCLGTLLALVPLAAAAAADESAPRLELRPARYAHEFAPGDTATVPVVAHNTTDQTLRLMFRSIALEAGAGDSFARPHPGDWDRSATGWLTFDERTVDLEPDQSYTLDVQVRIPPDARPGAYAVAVAASQEFRARAVSGDQVGSRVKVHADVGSTLVLAVTGDAVSEAKLRGVDSPRLVWGGDEPTFVADVENSGDTLLKLESATELSSFGAFASRTLKSTEHPTLPGGRRTLEMRWSDRPWIGWFRPTLVVVGGSGSGVRLERDLPTVFVLPPWWVIALVVAAIALPLWAGRHRRRELRERTRARAARRAARADDESLD